jgi:hypothetical protein
MADQTIKIQNDSGSHERVAFDLWTHIIGTTEDTKGLKTAEEKLKLYQRCLAATFKPLAG